MAQWLESGSDWLEYGLEWLDFEPLHRLSQ